MASKKKHTLASDVEWIGGIVELPTYVEDGGQAYRPELLVWQITNGPMLGYVVDQPGYVLEQAAMHFQSTQQKPLYGPPHIPKRVRVASSELADAIRPCLAEDTELVCAPTPELAELAQAMASFLEEKVGTPSYLSSGTGEPQLRAFFQATAELYRAAPWKVVPSDSGLIGVTSQALQLSDAALSIIGQLGQSFGLILFSSRADADSYIEAIEAAERGEPFAPPDHVGLQYLRGADLHPSLRKEIATHRWQVAGGNAYPALAAFQQGAAGAQPSAAQLSTIEAVALALPKLLADEPRFHAAWSGSDAILQTVEVDTHAGSVQVTFQVPASARRARTVRSLLEALSALEDANELDGQKRAALESELFAQFADSPEAATLRRPRWSTLVAELSAAYFDVTLASLRPTQLRKLVFELIPAKALIPASDAEEIVSELRALMRFLKREAELASAEACLAVLGAKAVSQLRAALSSSDDFSPVKSLLMSSLDGATELGSLAALESRLERAPHPPTKHAKPARARSTKATKKRGKPPSR